MASPQYLCDVLCCVYVLCLCLASSIPVLFLQILPGERGLIVFLVVVVVFAAVCGEVSSSVFFSSRSCPMILLASVLAVSVFLLVEVLVFSFLQTPDEG